MKKLLLSAIAGLFSLLTIAQSPEAAYTDSIVDGLQKITDSSILQKQIDSLLSVPDEHNYMALCQFYKKRNPVQGQIVYNIALEKWPKGILAQIAASRSMIAQTNMAKKEEIYKKAVKEFGYKEFGHTAAILAIDAADKGDKAKMLKYAAKVEWHSSQDLIGGLASELAKTNPRAALPLLRMAIDSAKSEYEERRSKSPTERDAIILMKNALESYHRYSAAYSQALVATGKAEQAWQYIEPVYKASDKSVYITRGYTETALANNKFSIALPFMERLMIADTASDFIMNNFEIAYAAVKGSNDGYDAYMDDLKKRKETKLREDIIAKSVSEPAQGFTLKDIDGNIVSLESLKGKVVVINFWASWCSRPDLYFRTMQMAVNKYRNDPDVEFLFIHTADKGDADLTYNVARYLKDNKLSFHVLIDPADKETGLSPVSFAYRIPAVPYKIVIDRKGNIRFHTQYLSQNEKGLTEISAMIDFALKNS